MSAGTGYDVYVPVLVLCPLQNVLDDRLRHANLGVVLGAVRLFLHLTDDMPQLQKDVHERIESKSALHTAVICTNECMNTTFYVYMYVYVHVHVSLANVHGHCSTDVTILQKEVRCGVIFANNDL